MPFGMLRSSSFAATYKNDANDAGGCCCPSGSEHCSETETLEIIREFRRLYEDQLRKIDKDGGGDCLELKVKLQQRWIEDLTAQTEMMAKVVKELELEATERVQMLEDKLEHSAKCACEKLYYLENDVKNLVEFVRRVREDGRWTIDGLQFYDITYEDLFGKDKKSSDESIPNDESRGAPGEDVIILPKDVQDKLLIELKKEVQQLRTQGNSSELLDELKRKSSEFENLRRSMLDMRSALTEEVACKHDMISLLKKDIQQLEERCLQADKQTAFKDDIIKEMRKEIKQLKQQKSLIKSLTSKDDYKKDKSYVRVQHNRKLEKARFSTVIFIDEDDGFRNRAAPPKINNTTKTVPSSVLSKSETELINNNFRDNPVKERSKFTFKNVTLPCSSFNSNSKYFPEFGDGRLLP